MDPLPRRARTRVQQWQIRRQCRRRNTLLDASRLWGANIYYDYRNTNRNNYNQVSLGFESLGKVWDFRLNGYLPVGNKTSSWSDLQFAKFRGHSLYVSRKRQFAMGSVNAEAGFHVDTIKDIPSISPQDPIISTGT